LFRVTIDSTDLGLYSASSRYTECPAGVGSCNTTPGIGFSLNVIDVLPVAEPATLSLLGLGLLGIAALRRRRSS
jgi:hypothetical protein